MGIDIDLSGKVAAITGGSRGIGRGIAEALLKTGASVAINGRNEEKGRQAIKEIGENQSVAFIKGDVRKQSEAENFIARTIEEFGKIDILVNNDTPVEVPGSDEPGITKREIDTKLLVSDGDIVVIGGIKVNTDTSTNSKTPGLGNVPVVGNLFKGRNSQNKLEEMLIFLAPRVIN
mgnify:CR=1 FL=1